MARFDVLGAHHLEGASQGSPDALFELGMMYSTGRDVEMDLVQAHKWFNLAAVRGNVDARQYRTEISAELSRADVAKAQRMAREWLSQN